MKLRAKLAAILLLVPVALAADPIEGLWLTGSDDNGNRGLVEVKACGAAFCGTLIKAYNTAGAEVAGPNIGRQIVWDTANKGNGVYRGKVFSPDRGKTYNSKLLLDGARLSVSGCVLGVCREGGIWEKQ
ncbi:MAG: DUF2147 domain-containing protein [Pseudomonadota bacterium]